jgi:hypothetical protein
MNRYVKLENDNYNSMQSAKLNECKRILNYSRENNFNFPV